MKLFKYYSSYQENLYANPKPIGCIHEYVLTTHYTLHKVFSSSSISCPRTAYIQSRRTEPQTKLSRETQHKGAANLQHHNFTTDAINTGPTARVAVAGVPVLQCPIRIRLHSRTEFQQRQPFIWIQPLLRYHHQPPTPHPPRHQETNMHTYLRG